MNNNLKSGNIVRDVEKGNYHVVHIDDSNGKYNSLFNLNHDHLLTRKPLELKNLELVAESIEDLCDDIEGSPVVYPKVGQIWKSPAYGLGIIAYNRPKFTIVYLDGDIGPSCNSLIQLIEGESLTFYGNSYKCLKN